MKVRRIATYLMLLVASSAELSQACMPMPSPIFGVPSYIDPDYVPPPYSEIKWGRNTMFRKLLADYGTIVSSPSAQMDSLARTISAASEPEEYAKYSRGAELFNSGSVAEAFAVFEGIKHNADSKRSWLSKLFGSHKSSWTREASTYMMARCKFVLSQNLWSGYGDPFGAIDQEQLAQADSLYAEYFSEYPDGLYSNSARNLKRRYYLFSGQKALLERDIKQMMLRECPHGGVGSTARQFRAEVINEFEDVGVKSIDFANDAPMLTAYAWLGNELPNIVDLNMLETRERDFSGYPGLFHYVKALGLYRMGRFQELLDKTPESPHKKTVVWLSTQLLRARAFARVGEDNAAVSAFKAMHDVLPVDLIDLEVGLIKLNKGEGLWLYGNESSVTSERSLKMFAAYGMQIQELERGLNSTDIGQRSKRIIADELSRRYVLSGQFDDLSRLLASGITWILDPEKEDIARLAKDSTDIEALVDLGEYLFAHSISPTSDIAASESDEWSGDFLSEVGSRCDSCDQLRIIRMAYSSPLKLFERAAEYSQKSGKRSESEAKALHYIVINGQLGSTRYRCSWTHSYDEETKTRAQNAFFRLHKLYPNSKWTEKTPYYY